MPLRKDLVDHMHEGWVIDTHEHLQQRPDSFPDNLFALWQQSYVKADFASAGASAALGEAARSPDAAAWRRLRPYVRRVSNTAYYRSLLVACHDLYGLEGEDITDDTWQALNEAIQRRNAKPGWGEEVFRRGKIRKVLLDTFWDQIAEELPLGGDFLVRVMRINSFVMGVRRGRVDHGGHSPYSLQEQLGVTVSSLGDYLDLFEAALEWYLTRGAVALKSALAYDRELYFEDVRREDAERLFAADDDSPQTLQALGDFMMHHILGRAQELELPVQVHTGYLAGGGHLVGRDPKRLTNLLEKYRGVQFDLFHGGYPYAGELAFLGKHYANVYVDLCWLPLISPTAARRYLHEWIEQVPINKILWGGDCTRPDAVYGAVRYGQEVVATVLAEKVREGYMPEDLAFELATRIFHDNAAELFLGEVHLQ